VRAAQAALPAESFALVIASLPSRLALWVVTRDRVRVVEHQLSRQEVLARVDRLVDAIRAGLPTDAGVDEMRRWLIDPIAPELARHRAVVVVADDVLARLPFQFIASAEDPPGARPIEIVHAPSLSAWRRASSQARADAPRPAVSMLIVVNPLVSATFLSARRPLPSAPRDVPTLVNTRRTELRGDAATSDAIVAALPHHDVFHFSGHAIGAFTRASLAGLLVTPRGTDGGLLTARNLRGLERGRLRLVVLAGCSTAAGPVSSSEGPQSVAWGFLTAGVPSIVATLWDVDDASTAAFMTAFYSALPTRGPVSAVAHAQRTLRESGNPLLAAPNAWAGFVVLGA
jgi:CHAT domain-containing protein